MTVSESGGGRKTTTMVGKRGGKPSRKKATVSSQFKVSTTVQWRGEEGAIYSICKYCELTVQGVKKNLLAVYVFHRIRCILL